MKILISSENGDVTGHKFATFRWADLGSVCNINCLRDLTINTLWDDGECEYQTGFYFTYKVYIYKNGINIYTSPWLISDWTYTVGNLLASDLIKVDIVYQTITSCIGRINNHAHIYAYDEWSPTYQYKENSTFLNEIDFDIKQNYPNPFNSDTTIDFTLASDSRVTLKLFDVLGQEVMTLINGNYSSGMHKVNFDASGLNSGVYVYRIDAVGVDGKTFTSTRKMILNK